MKYFISSLLVCYVDVKDVSILEINMIQSSIGNKVNQMIAKKKRGVVELINFTVQYWQLLKINHGNANNKKAKISH